MDTQICLFLIRSEELTIISSNYCDSKADYNRKVLIIPHTNLQFSIQPETQNWDV